MSYITPDQVYKDAPDAIPFIYTKEHHLEVGRPGDVHMASTENINFNKKYPNITKGEQLGELGLLGRIANDYDDWRVNDQFYPSLVTFWNHDKSMYGLLDACLKALMNKNLIHESTFVSTPFHRIPTMVKDLNKSIIHNLTNQDKERIDQLRKIHLMGAEKGQVLKKLGIQSKIGPRRPVIGDHFNLNFKNYLNEAMVSTENMPEQILKSLELLVPAGTWDWYSDARPTNSYTKKNLEMAFTAYAVKDDHDKFYLMVSFQQGHGWAKYDSIHGDPFIRFKASLAGWKPGMDKINNTVRSLKTFATSNDLKTPYDIAKWTKEKIDWFYRGDNGDDEEKSPTPKMPSNSRSPVLV